MKFFKPQKGISAVYILLLMIFTNVLTQLLIHFLDSYILHSLFRVALIVINIYLVYYFLVSVSLIYIIDGEVLFIKRLWGLRKVKIPVGSIEGYVVREGNIHGVKLSGFGNNRFAFGRSIIDKIGTSHMFVTSSRKTIYLKTANITYGLSPRQFVDFAEILKSKGINEGFSEFRLNKNLDLYKEKMFFIPFILDTILIIMLTLNPFILYLKNKLPLRMPLNFNAVFEPIQFGTGKEFAFKQMTYGVLNMIILLCMYYASYFCAKYDRKTAYKYIYGAMIISLTFLIIQMRILIKFI